jgi:hypothetical protein
MQATGKRKPKREGDHPGCAQLAEDRYSFAEDIDVLGLNDYGHQAIPEDRIALVSRYMKSIKEGSDVSRLAKACRKAGVMVSESDMGSAIEQVNDYDHAVESGLSDSAAEFNIETELENIHDELSDMNEKLDSISGEEMEIEGDVDEMSDDFADMSTDMDEVEAVEDEVEEVEDEVESLEDETEMMDDVEYDSELPEPEEGMAESQFKFPTAKKKRGLKSYAPRDHKRGSVAEGAIKWLTKQDDAILGEARGVRFILDHGNRHPSFPPALLSEDGQIQIPMPQQLHEDAFKVADENQVSHRLHQYILRNVTVLRPISESEEEEITQTVAEIQRGAEGGVSIKLLDPSVVVQGADDSMTPVDGVSVDLPESEEADDDSMPDFGGDELEAEELDSDAEMGEIEDIDELEEDAEEALDDEAEAEEDEAEAEEDEAEAEEDEEEAEEDEEEAEEDEEGVAEDHDITSPAHNAYKGLLNQDPRQDVEVKMPSKNKGDHEEGFGSTRSLKKIDKHGNTPNVKFED